MTETSLDNRHHGARELRVVLEIGPKGKKVVAVAPDWPGLERGGANEEVALATLTSYLPRYAAVADSAGLGDAFEATGTLRVIERYPGVGSTDFWGISFAFSSIDQRPVSLEELDREISLMRACWTFFDDVRSRVSVVMKKGPRGGGRDRDHIVRHTFVTERDWARKLGLAPTADVDLLEPEGLALFRRDYCAALRTLHADGKAARTWPLRFLIRHTAFHTMDHAWEMEDKDLSDHAG